MAFLKYFNRILPKTFSVGSVECSDERSKEAFGRSAESESGAVPARVRIKRRHRRNLMLLNEQQLRKYHPRPQTGRGFSSRHRTHQHQQHHRQAHQQAHTTIINRRQVSNVIEYYSRYTHFNPIINSSMIAEDDTNETPGSDMISAIDSTDRTLTNEPICQAKAAKSGHGSLCSECKSAGDVEHKSRFCKCCGAKIKSQQHQARSKTRETPRRFKDPTGGFEGCKRPRFECDVPVEARKRRRSPVDLLDAGSTKRSRRKSLGGGGAVRHRQHVNHYERQPCCLVNGRSLSADGQRWMLTSTSLTMASFLMPSSPSSASSSSSLSPRRRSDALVHMKQRKTIQMKKSTALSNIKAVNVVRFKSPVYSQSHRSCCSSAAASAATTQIVKITASPGIVLRARASKTTTTSTTPSVILKIKDLSRQSAKREPTEQSTCSSFLVDIASTPIKTVPKTSTPKKDQLTSL